MTWERLLQFEGLETINDWEYEKFIEDKLRIDVLNDIKNFNREDVGMRTYGLKLLKQSVNLVKETCDNIQATTNYKLQYQ